MKNQLYEYLQINRGVGHTRLLIDGARNAQYPFLVVGGDKTQAIRMIRELGNEFAIPTSIDNPKDYHGHNHPVLIDNYAFLKTCESYIGEIRDQRETLAKKEAELIKKEKTINDITALPIWVRLFTPLYKRVIKKLR